MDFRNRNEQSSQSGRVPMPGQTVQAQQAQQVPQQPREKNAQPKQPFGGANLPTWIRLANVALLFSITILAIAVVLLFRNSNPNEGKYVSTAHYQAVFLNNGQVYFGKIQNLTTKYVDLQSIFYLNSQNQSATDTSKTTTNTSSNDLTLIKLGCELHGPYDEMIINRDQISFWENLKDDSQVVKTIKTWQQQNPKGQTCSTTTASTTQSTGTSSTGTGTTSTTGTTGTTSTGTTTKN